MSYVYFHPDGRSGLDDFSLALSVNNEIRSLQVSIEGISVSEMEKLSQALVSCKSLENLTLFNALHRMPTESLQVFVERLPHMSVKSLNFFGAIFEENSLPLLVKMLRQADLRSLRVGRLPTEHCVLLREALADLALTGVVKIYNEEGMNLESQQLKLLRIRNLLLSVWLGRDFHMFNDAAVYFSTLMNEAVEELFDLYLPEPIGVLLSSFLVSREVGEWVQSLPKEWPSIHQTICHESNVYR